jgi:hypothetical protein
MPKPEEIDTNMFAIPTKLGIILGTYTTGQLLLLTRSGLHRFNDFAILHGLFDELPHPKPHDSLEI